MSIRTLCTTVLVLPQVLQSSVAGAENETRAERLSSIAALERAYEAFPLPATLLSLAAVQARSMETCRDAIVTFGRFFAACQDCPALSLG